MQKGWPLRMTDESLQPYYRVRSELSLWGKDLKCLARGQRVIIPQKLREKVLGIAHEGHLGMVRMKQRCREVVWWPGMGKQVENWVRHCEACLLSGKSVHPRVAPLQPQGIIYPVSHRSCESIFVCCETKSDTCRTNCDAESGCPIQVQ